MIDLPTEVRSGIARYMRRSGLAYGAADLLGHADGSFTVLEVNPEGNYAWLEPETGLPITESIAAYLMGDPHSHDR